MKEFAREHRIKQNAKVGEKKKWRRKGKIKVNPF